MTNTSTKSFKLSLFLFISILSTASGQTQTFKHKLKQTVNSIDNSWTVEIDTLTKNKHIALVSGTFVGLMRLKKNNDLIEYYIYKPTNESFKNEILQYHMLASCTLSSVNYKYEVLKFKDYLLFLPMYPCWTSGYSEDAKKLIGKLVIKLK